MKFSFTVSTGLVACITLMPSESNARYSFDSSFLQSANHNKDLQIDLAYFNQGGTFLPGNYSLAVYINNDFVTRRDINFVSTKEMKLTLCLSENDLRVLGIDYPFEDNSACLLPEEQQFRWKADLNAMRLDLVLPQIYLRKNDYFKVPWQSWDNGNTAFLTNYDYSFSESRYRGDKDNNQFLRLQSGFNLQGWRLRNESSWTKSETKDTGLESRRIYVQHDYALGQGGELTVGQTWSEGSIFDSVPFKGLMLSSRDDMLKNEFRNYTPAVNGVVNTQSATIRVIKSGNVIYQENLPSGPFSLDGVMVNGGGDYLIEIKEADGSVRSYTQSADSLPELQTKGRFKHNIVIGKSDISDAENTSFNQASIFYGLTDKVTLYGGGLYTKDYLALNFGAGMKIEGIGALSSDLTVSNNNHERSSSGQSIRASWQRDFDATATSFGLFAYRYSSEEYMGFEEYLKYRQQGDNPMNKKNRVEMILTKNFQEYGSVSVSGRKESYWSGEKSNFSTRLNHNIRIGKASLNSYYDQRKTINNKDDKVIGMSINIPLKDSPNVYLSSRISREKGRLMNQNTVNISPIEDNRLIISASAGKEESASSSKGIQASYSGNLYDISTGYYNTANTSKYNIGLRGGAVIHSRGITAGRSISIDSPVAIVSTPGISGVRINNQTNIETDYNGNAVISNLLPYQRNKISIDVTSLSDNSDATDTDSTIIPSGGSVIPVVFDVNVGKRALFNVMYRNRPVPLGALATVGTSNGRERTLFFADNGQLYLTGVNSNGSVRVDFGGRTCQFEYDTGDGQENDIYKQTVECK